MGELVQKNSGLRVEAKQAARRATAAEGALKTAQERVAALEQALTDMALDSGEGSTARAEIRSPAASIVSLGEGHGGVDLGGNSCLASPLSHTSVSPNQATVLDVDTLVPGSPARELEDSTASAPAPSKGRSPPRLTLDEAAPAPAVAIHKASGGCCIVS
jgi:hypothetical protein